MKTTFSEKFVAYLALLSGLAISGVAVYYSVIGLTSIFAAAAIPIIIMGSALEISKLVATVWLKQNWKIAPFAIKSYLISAIAVLMLITSMGIFGFLSKAHSDQSLVSGDVLAKISVYDEKIKISKENIDTNRKALKQLDDAVDQVMARSTSEQAAEKSMQIRRSQVKERSRLLVEIETEQKTVSHLNDERAPVAAEIRKVEAEVGPLKYIAAFFYGSTDPTILEKAVTWVIISLIIVFDPLAVILLLSSQISFQRFREREDPKEIPVLTDDISSWFSNAKERDNFLDQTTNENLENDFSDQQVKNPIEPEIPIIEDPVAEPTEYVQNEEQQESNRWSSARVKLITQEEYVDHSKQKREENISAVIEKIKSGTLRLDDVHPGLHKEIKARL